MCIYVLCLVLLTSVNALTPLRTIRVQVGSESGDGMDGGLFRNKNWGGGRFKFEFCASGNICCQTPNLNTHDDNWEVGEVNFFIGHQIGECENFDLDVSDLDLTVIHSGNDGGKIDAIELMSSKRKQDLFFECQVGQKLDDDEQFSTSCSRRSGEKFSDEVCNGRPEFCDLKFNEFIFPGVHNAGTGMASKWKLDCYVRNQDLSLTEMLDFGIRFFDFDTRLEHDELWTGHGKGSVYFSFGKVKKAVVELKSWLNAHPEELIVFYVGEILGNRTQALHELKQILNIELNGNDGNVGLNTFWHQNQEWPTLKEAVRENQRVFAFARFQDQEELDLLKDSFIIPENKVKAGKPVDNFTGKYVNVLSTFKSMNIGHNCDDIIENIRTACQAHPDVDFTKLAIFGTHPKNSILKCLPTFARPCNSRVQDAIKACQETARVNFLQLDFPNYPGPGRKTSVDISQTENLKSQT